MSNTTKPEPDQYQFIAQELQRNMEERPNYQPTMELHKALEKLFKKGPHQVQHLAPWHWDDQQSTHAVETFLTYPNGKKVAAAITQHVEKNGLLIQAIFTDPNGRRTDAGEHPHQQLVDRTSLQFGTEYHAQQPPNCEMSHIIYAVSPDTKELPDTINRVAQAAATIAAAILQPQNS